MFRFCCFVSIVAIIIIVIMISPIEVFVPYNKRIGLYYKYNENDQIIYSKIKLNKDFIYDFTLQMNHAIKLFNSITNINKSNEVYYVAFVKKTCGIGCGKLGGPGIEIEISKLRSILNSYYKEKNFDSLLYYELGRNFWFYDNQLSYNSDTSPLRDGFAIFMRAVCIEKLNFHHDSINGISCYEYIDDLKNWYFSQKVEMNSNTYISFCTTLGSYQMSNNNKSWASIFYNLYCEFGNDWLYKFWKEIYLLQETQGYLDIYQNVYLASCVATNNNLELYFTKKLNWSFNYIRNGNTFF